MRRMRKGPLCFQWRGGRTDYSSARRSRGALVDYTSPRPLSPLSLVLLLLALLALLLPGVPTDLTHHGFYDHFAMAQGTANASSVTDETTAYHSATTTTTTSATAAPAPTPFPTTIASSSAPTTPLPSPSSSSSSATAVPQIVVTTTATGGSALGDVVLTTDEGIGRVAKEALISMAITIVFLLPYIFDQFLMANVATRYNGRKVDVVLGGGGGGGRKSDHLHQTNVAAQKGSKELLPAPPFLPLGINSTVHVAGYPIDGPREYLIYSKVTSRMKPLKEMRRERSERRAAAAASGGEEGDMEEDLLDLGPKPFAHRLVQPKGGDSGAAAAERAGEVLGGKGGALSSAANLAPLIAHPPLIRNYHRRVDPSYAESVMCCLDEGMEVRLPPVPVGEVMPAAAGSAAGARERAANTNNDGKRQGGGAGDDVNLVEMDLVVDDEAPLMMIPSAAAAAAQSSLSSRSGGAASSAAIPIDVDDLGLLGGVGARGGPLPLVPSSSSASRPFAAPSVTAYGAPLLQRGAGADADDDELAGLMGMVNRSSSPAVNGATSRAAAAAVPPPIIPMGDDAHLVLEEGQGDGGYAVPQAKKKVATKRKGTAASSTRKGASPTAPLAGGAAAGSPAGDVDL